MITLGIGTFYVTSAKTVTTYPEFGITHVNGDKAKIEEVIIQADYFRQNINQAALITTNNTLYRSEFSYVERLEGAFREPTIKRWEKDYKSFMRGKRGWLDSFYEDENYLVFGDIKINYNNVDASMKDSKLYVARLDKKTGEATSFEVKLPNSGEYYFANLQDIQFVDGKLKLIAMNGMENGGTAVHMYTLDMKSKKLIGDERIIGPEALPDNQNTEIMMLGQEFMTHKPNEYAVFRKVVIDETYSKEGDYQRQELANELIAYHYASGKTEQLKLPKKLEEQGQVSLFDGAHLYYTTPNEKGIDVIVYSITNQKIKNNYLVAIQVGANEELPYMTVKDDVLYVMKRMVDEENGATIQAFDAMTGTSVYEGKIGLKEENKAVDEFQLYLSQLQFDE